MQCVRAENIKRDEKKKNVCGTAYQLTPGPQRDSDEEQRRGRGGRTRDALRSYSWELPRAPSMPGAAPLTLKCTKHVAYKTRNESSPPQTLHRLLHGARVLPPSDTAHMRRKKFELHAEATTDERRQNKQAMMIDEQPPTPQSMRKTSTPSTAAHTKNRTAPREAGNSEGSKRATNTSRSFANARRYSLGTTAKHHESM